MSPFRFSLKMSPFPSRFHPHPSSNREIKPLCQPSYLANGYSLEMSNKAEKHNPTLIRPESIQGWSKSF